MKMEKLFLISFISHFSFRIIRPLIVAGAVNETCTEGGENHVVTLLQTVLVLPDSQGDGGSGRVTEMLDVDNHLLHGDLQTLGDGLDDTHVGLMGNDPLDRILVKTIALGDKGTVVAHVGHRIAEHGATLLIEVVQTVVNCEMTGRAD